MNRKDNILFEHQKTAEEIYKNHNISNIEFFFNNKRELMVKFYCYEKFCDGTEHGEQIQTGYHFLKGKGCAKCATRYNRAYTTEEWVRLAKSKYPEFTYEKVNYINKDTKVCIICPKHGEVFVNPKEFLHGKRYCPQCTKEKQHDNFVQNIIKKAQKIHKSSGYIYHPELIISSTEKIGIECPKHGIFYQYISNHITKKSGCPICNESKLEKEIRDVLIENNIKFESQKRFQWLGKQSLDFYLPEYNIAIECQGGQHFEVFDFYKGEEGLEKIKERDKIKKQLCQENNIKLIYFFTKQYNKYMKENDIYFNFKKYLINYIKNI